MVVKRQEERTFLWQKTPSRNPVSPAKRQNGSLRPPRQRLKKWASQPNEVCTSFDQKPIIAVLQDILQKITALKQTASLLVPAEFPLPPTVAIPASSHA